MDGRKSIPTHSACGETNSVDHSLICKPSSYTSMRHNSVRDSGAQIMRKVCRDVQTEPTLFPINKNNFEIKVDFANNARLDISVRGLEHYEKTFFNMRITHPTLQSYSDKFLAQIYQQHEKRRGECTIKEWLTLRGLQPIPLSLQQVVGNRHGAIATVNSNRLN